MFDMIILFIEIEDCFKILVSQYFTDSGIDKYKPKAILKRDK
jgi:hypothetical protein